MIPRQMEKEFRFLLQEYPIVTLLGPRQSGKTTLAKLMHPEFQYVNLEQPEIREFASQDPKAFFAKYPSPLILDEIQRVPQLLSYLQVEVDQKSGCGHYILTGSHQLQLREAISQSLAGRTAILNLLPLSITELEMANLGFSSVEEYLYHGFLPRIFDQNQRPTPAYSNYYQTYIERDVRLLINVKDASQFETFIKLLAGRVGQLMDYSSLAGDVGVSAHTIKHWISILEASFLLFKLPPFFRNFGKRLVKAPKYYFMDTGLLCFLLGIESPEQVSRDPLYGHIFENLIVLEAAKNLFNSGKLANLYFFRDSNGFEIDLLYPKGREYIPIEIKSASTYKPELLKGLQRSQKYIQNSQRSYLAYTGETMNFSNGIQAVRFDELGSVWNQES